MKREHHLSAQISHNKSKIIYLLQGEKRAPFVSPDLTQQIQDHTTYLLQGEKKAPFVSPDLTQQIQDHLLRCKVKREHHLSAQISHNKSKIAYILQGEKSTI
jgi:hypothetical protein